MKEIKGTFNYYFSHVHRGSHRTSNGFKYNYYDTRGVSGPFFDQIIPLSYQDLIKLRTFASEVNSKYYYYEEDYEWAESYTPNASSEQNKDFGLCKFFNEHYSQQYGIILINGTLKECSIHIDEMPPLKCFKIAYNDAQTSQKLKKKEIQSEIAQITQKLLKLNDNLKIIDSSQTFQEILLKELYVPLKRNIHMFELNEPFFLKLYPLDIAISNHDESLLDALIANGAYQYNSEFDPSLSAKCGNFCKVFDIINKMELLRIDILNIYNLIVSLPDAEFYSLFESKSDLIRNGRVLLSYRDKFKIFFSIRTYYKKRVYKPSFDIEPIRVILENLMRTKNFSKANYIYDFFKSNFLFTGFYKDDMLLLSFEYGDIEYIKRWDIRNLINYITDRFSYSVGFNELVFDRRGNVLCLKEDFEPYVTPENIGKELYNQIIDQIKNHSSKYTCD